MMTKEEERRRDDQARRMSAWCATGDGDEVTDEEREQFRVEEQVRILPEIQRLQNQVAAHRVSRPQTDNEVVLLAWEKESERREEVLRAAKREETRRVRGASPKLNLSREETKTDASPEIVKKSRRRTEE